jgi:hypothetical protein
MGRLIYSMIVSADGYVADRDGEFSQWAQPDEEVLNEINSDLEDVDVYLYGRRMYEVMSVWEMDPEVITQSPNSEVFARSWQSAQKIVYFGTLVEVVITKTQLQSSFGLPAGPHRIQPDGPSSSRCTHMLGVLRRFCPIDVRHHGGAMRSGSDHDLALGSMMCSWQGRPCRSNV